MPTNKRALSLNGPWTLKEIGDDSSYPAIVPGCVHSDLIDADVIEKPYEGDKELDYLWVGQRDWSYERTFFVDPDFRSNRKMLLRCHGLDTLARVFVNDNLVGKTENMFRSYDFDVSEFIVDGDNTIRIEFTSPLSLMKEKSAKRKLNCWNEPYGIEGRGYVRKEACNFGWDWGPSMVSCGIYKDIELVSIEKGSIREVYVRQKHAEDGEVKLTFSAGVPSIDGLKMRFSVLWEGEVVACSEENVNDSKVFAFCSVPTPRLWWPNGMGEQALYTCRVELLDSNDELVDVWERRIGLRTIVLDTDSDEWGQAFRFVVNGVPFFAKGANWIPVDPFPGPDSENRAIAYLESAAWAHMNMIRVWGGGVYESEAFYDRCDELGLCVWQDFMFACGTYPLDDKKFVNNVMREVRDQVRRLQHRACLALWCGNNEMEQGMADPSWQESCSWDVYKEFFDKTLLKGLRKQDHDTSYWPSSPHTPGDQNERENVQDDSRGDAHLWTPWFEGVPFESYQETDHRFNSEFGFQSLPALETVRSFAGDDELNVSSYSVDFHQRSPVGNRMMFHQILEWFRMPSEFEGVIYTSQIIQLLAIEMGVLHWRSNQPRSMGALYWQLNDNWPCVSWASIDSVGRYKALHYGARRFFAPVAVNGRLLEEGQGIEVSVLNDTAKDLNLLVRTVFADASGKVLKSVESEVAVNAFSLTKEKIVEDDLLKESLRPKDLVVWHSVFEGKLKRHESVLFVTRPKYLPISKAKIKIKKLSDSRIELKSNRAAYWCWLQDEGDTAFFSDNAFHLFPGETKQIDVSWNSDSEFAGNLSTISVKSLKDYTG